jgi:hypothetical protein
VYNDLDVFLIDNSSIPKDFQLTNEFDEKFIHFNGTKENLQGCINRVWSGDFNAENDVLKVNDKVYFLGQNNKSIGIVKRFNLNAKFPKHCIIECTLKVKKGDSGGILFKHNTVKNEFIAVGICSYFLGDRLEDSGYNSFFVPLTDLDKSIYELP